MNVRGTNTKSDVNTHKNEHEKLKNKMLKNTSSSCALCRHQTEAKRPASLAESEYPSITSWCGCQPTLGTCVCVCVFVCARAFACGEGVGEDEGEGGREG